MSHSDTGITLSALEKGENSVESKTGNQASRLYIRHMSLISHSTAAAASSLVAQMQLQLHHWSLSCSCQFRFRPVERTWEWLMSPDLNYHEKLRGEIVTWPQFIEQWIRVIMRLQQQRRQKPRWPAERMEKYFTFRTFSAFYLAINISNTCAFRATGIHIFGWDFCGPVASSTVIHCYEYCTYLSFFRCLSW